MKNHRIVMRNRAADGVVCLLVFLVVAFLVTPSEAVEEGQVCRFCLDCQRAAAIGIDLEGDGPRYAPDRQVDVLHIKLDVTPDFKQRTLSGTATISFAPIGKPVSELTLDAVDLTIKAVRSPAGVADYAATARDLTVAFNRPIPVSEKTQIEIDYHCQPRRGMYFRTPEMGYPAPDTHLWTQGEAHEGRFWYPCFDYPNERSSTEVICHVPQDMTVLSNGKRMSESLDKSSGLKSVRWLQEKPHANYLICLVAGYFQKLEKRHGDLPLAFYSQPSLFKHAANSFRDTAAIMAFYEQEIGIPFPWDKYYQVTVLDFLAAGMENTSLTTLFDRTIFTTNTENIRSARMLDAHELAHQWFGNYVTCKDWSHLWLNEGFAVYYSYLYEAHKFGRDELLYQLFKDAHNKVLSQRSSHKPVVYKDYKNAREQFDYRAYPKGSWILHMLHSQLGERMFRRCVKTYLQRHEYSSVVTEDLNAVLEELTGRSFDPFFDQWVYHARHPDLKVTYRWLPQAQLAKVTVKQTHEVDDGVMLFRFPTSLRFIVDGQRVDHPIQIDKVKQDFYVRLTAKPTIVRFDPQYTVLADVTFEKSDKLLYAQLANHDDVIGRLIAVEALGKQDTHEAVEKLKTALQNDPFYGVRIAAADALREIHNDTAFEALAASWDQSDARVRLQVVETIGQFYRPQTAALMLELLADEKNPAIAAAAIRTLGRFHGVATETVIFKYLRSESYRNELADAAVAAIRMLGDAAHADKLQTVMAEREKAFTTSGFASALDALASICREQEDKTDVRKFLTGYLNHPREKIRIAAVTALGTLGDPRSLPVLETFSSDEAADRVGQAAKTALKELSKKSPVVPDELIQLRETVSELREQNEELRKDVDDLKKRLGAADEDDDQHEKHADQDKDDR